MKTILQPAKPFRVISDGSSHGTHIFDPSGKKLGLVVDLKIQVNPENFFAEITQIKNIGKGPSSTSYVLLPVELDIEIPISKIKKKSVIIKPKKKTPEHKSLLPG